MLHDDMLIMMMLTVDMTIRLLYIIDNTAFI